MHASPLLAPVACLNVEQELAQHASSPWRHTSMYKIGHTHESASLWLVHNLEPHAVPTPTAFTPVPNGVA